MTNQRVTIGPAGFSLKEKTPEVIEYDLASGSALELDPEQDSELEPEKEPEKEPEHNESVEPEKVIKLTEVKKIVTEPKATATLRVYSEKCVNCKHLFDKAKKIYNSCHFTPNRANKFKGNKYCPAQNTKIEILLPIEKAARAIVAHTRSGNMTRVGQLYKKLDDFSAEQKEACLERVGELLQKPSKS